MARFFKAPTVQPIDYGFDLPFKEILGVLQNKQKVQDTNLANLEQILEKVPKAKEADFDVRRNFLAERQKRIDNLIADEKGMLKDLTGASGLIRQEARKQLKEERPGGKYWALNQSYDIWEKYTEDIKKNDKISQERKNWLLAESENRYKGIGEKEEYSEYDLFQGIIAQDEVDEFKIVDEALDGWDSNKIQIAKGPDGTTRISPTQEYLDELSKKYPEYASVLNGDYFQTGELEYVLMDDLVEHGTNILYNNQSVVQDLKQEAEQKGLTDPVMQQAYIQQKIGEAVNAAAEKYSYAKFSPKTIENWRAKKAVDQAYKKSYAKWEDARNMRTLQIDNRTQQRGVKVSEIYDIKKTSQEALDVGKEKIKEYLNPDGTVKQSVKDNPVRYDAYLQAKQNIVNARGQIAKANNILKNQVDMSKLDLKSSTISTLDTKVNTLIDDLPVDETTKNQVAKLYNDLVVDKINNYDSQELNQYLLDYGELPKGLSDVLTVFQSRLNDLGIEGSQAGPLKAVNYRIKNLGTEFKTDILASSNNALQRAVSENVPLSKDIDFTTTYPVMSSYSGAGAGFSGALGAYQKGLEDAVKRGVGTWVNPVTGDPLDPNLKVASLGGDLSKVKIDPSVKYDPELGVPVFVLSTQHKKTGEQIQFAIAATPETANSFQSNTAEIAVSMFEASFAKESEREKKSDFERGAYMLGQVRYAKDVAESGILLSPPGKNALIANENIFIEKTPENYFAMYPVKVVNGRKVPDYEKPIPDSRKYSNTPGTTIFKSENEIYQQLGEAIYHREKNKIRR